MFRHGAKQKKINSIIVYGAISAIIFCCGCIGPDEGKTADSPQDAALKKKLLEMAKKQTEPKKQEISAPELENVNIYARALEIRLRRKYNSMPIYAGEIGRVKLLCIGKPQVSTDGKKLRVRWSQIVIDNWGIRVPDLEKEYFEVVFAEGKPMAFSKKPTITIGLDNESGYSEFSPVRGRELSGRDTRGNPEMFDRPDSEKNGLLDDNLRRKNSSPLPLRELDEKGYSENFSATSGNNGGNNLPEVQPARDNLQALLAR